MRRVGVIALVLLGIAFMCISGHAAVLYVRVFSGRVDPILTLEQSDLARLSTMLGEASPMSPPDPNVAFPPNRLGYRGVEVRGWPQDNSESSLRIRGQYVLLTTGESSSWFSLPNTALESYLTDLADARGVIDEGLDQDIRLEIEKNSPDTRFLDDFNGRIDPAWTGPLPDTTNSYPSTLFLHAGAPGYRFENLGGARVLRLTNDLASNERRGWSASETFRAKDFRFQARFNLMDYSSSSGGLIELWILDPRDPHRFDFASLFRGFSVAPITFGSASSLRNDRFSEGWFNFTRNTFYRIMIEVSASRKLQAALLADSGEQVFRHTFEHTADEFPEGFKIGFSHSGSPLTPPSQIRLNEIAIDFIHLTGTDSAAAERREALYDFPFWGGQISTRYDSTVKNWTPDFRSPLVTNFILRAEGAWTNGQRAANYMFADPDNPEVLLRLRTWEGSNVLSAHRAMLDQIGLLTEARPTPLPLASTIGLDLGDRSYLFGALTNNILFVRNNVFVCLAEESLAHIAPAAHAPAREPAVRRIARLLDSQLAARGFTGPALLQPRLAQGGFHATVPTSIGRKYHIEFNHSLDPREWTAHTSFLGDGSIRGVTLPALNSRTFLRLRAD